jgi:acetyltransferase-like isoleucine patch superfamily enzyme
MSIDFAKLDSIRAGQGYLSLAETLALADHGNAVLDPFSLLIGRAVAIGAGNIFYPNVTIGGAITVGDRNAFHSGTALFAASGRIAIGSRNQLGEGGFTARADGAGDLIEIGDDGRYLGGVSLGGTVQLGSGCQILGAIAVQSCVLAAGGSFEEPDPDARGAVLKGVGRARGLKLARGQVIQGNGVFGAEDVKPQSFYHPFATR